MKISAKDIELFKNLSEFDSGEKYYDFHNDYKCIRISQEDEELTFLFKKTDEAVVVSFKFQEVKVTKFVFDYTTKLESLTIDNCYRGRFELGKDLLEFSSEGKSYFYVEFYEGHKLEFFSEYVIIENVPLIIDFPPLQ